MNYYLKAPPAKPVVNLSDLSTIEEIFKKLAACAHFDGFPEDAMTMEIQRIKANVLSLAANSEGGQLPNSYVTNALDGVVGQIDQLWQITIIAIDRYKALAAELEQLKAGAQ